MSRLLVIDVGTSGIRTLVVDDAGTEISEHAEEFAPDSPAPGLVEFEPQRLLAVVDRLLAAAASEPVDAIGITNQRATTIVWDRASGEPIGPALGWQDVRTVGQCLELQAEGIRLAPNATATKAAWLLDTFDPDRSRDLCVGTVDSYVAWHLTGEHVTDRSNASATGLVVAGASAWDVTICERLGVQIEALPTIVDSAGVIGPVAACGGAPLAGIAGDQQASLLGQGAVAPGQSKITFGTGAMLDVNAGTSAPPPAQHGTFPLAAWHRDGVTTYLTEAIMLSAGTCVAWLRDGLSIVDSLDEVDPLAGSVEHTDGVCFVPAMQGLGTPHWDHGARGALLGLTRGTTRAHVCRAVLEGVAMRASELVDAAEADSGHRIDVLRIDGGMTASSVFVQAVADATGRRVEVSSHREATAVGAAYLAGIGTGVWPDEAATADLWEPARVVEPSGDPLPGWPDAVARAASWIPELSGLSF